MRVMRLSLQTSIGQAVYEGSFRRPAAADALFDGFAFCFVPGTYVNEDRFFNIFTFPYSKYHQLVPQKSSTS